MPLLLIVLIAFCMLLQHGKQAAEGAAWVARLFFAGAVMLAGSVALAGPMRVEIATWGPAKLALLLDPLSSLMFLLVSFLGIVVTRYAINYLDGDARQATFSRWLVLTLTSVLVLVLSSNLLLFTAAWIATSLSLHQLHTFYRERPAAVIAARNGAESARQAAAANPGDAASLQKLGAAEAGLGGVLGRLFAVSEAYPDLKANQNMMQLTEELTTTENKVAFSRQAYNDSVLAYNNKREVFPNIFFAGIFGFAEGARFEIESPAEREAPEVKF